MGLVRSVTWKISEVAPLLRSTTSLGDSVRAQCKPFYRSVGDRVLPTGEGCTSEGNSQVQVVDKKDFVGSDR